MVLSKAIFFPLTSNSLPLKTTKEKNISLVLPSEETKGDFFGPGFIANGVESPNSELRSLKGTQASSSEKVSSEEGHERTPTYSYPVSLSCLNKLLVEVLVQAR